MAETTAAVEQEFKLLALDLIHESKTNPRKTFDPKALEDLTASVKQMGVIVPILVRPIGAQFEVVAGARRFRAAKKAGLSEIQAIVRELSDDAALEAQVIENLQRADVHPLEEAEGYKALLARKRHTVESLADQVGKSVSYIWQRLKLTELIGSAQQAFLTDQITAGHAILIARLTPADQKDALAHCIQKVDVAAGEPDDWGHKPKIEQSLIPVRALARWIEDDVHRDLGRMPWDMKDDKLVAKAGSCQACPKRTGNTPALFPDVQKESTCTDHACFKEKFNAWIDRSIKMLKAQKTKVIVISEEQYNWRLAPIEGRAGVKRKGEYHEPGKKRCKNIGLGIQWDGKNRGQSIQVCTAASCSVHNPKTSYSSRMLGSSSSAAPDPEAAARAAEKRKREEEARQAKELLNKTVRGELFRQVCNKVREVPRVAIEFLVARELSFGDSAPYLAEILPCTKERVRFGPTMKAISDLGPIEFAKVAVGVAFRDALMGEAGNESLKLSQLAKEIGINVEALEKGIRGKLEAEARDAKVKSKRK